MPPYHLQIQLVFDFRSLFSLAFRFLCAHHPCLIAQVVDLRLLFLADLMVFRRLNIVGDEYWLIACCLTFVSLREVLDIPRHQQDWAESNNVYDAVDLDLDDLISSSYLFQRQHVQPLPPRLRHQTRCCAPVLRDRLQRHLVTCCACFFGSPFLLLLHRHTAGLHRRLRCQEQ